MWSVMDTNPSFNNKMHYEKALKAGKNLISSLQTGGERTVCIKQNIYTALD